MFQKIIKILSIFLFIVSCSKNEEIIYKQDSQKNPFTLYQEAYSAFERGDYFFAEKKFSEAELNFEVEEFAAKSAIMSSYALYGINFYDESLDNLERYLKNIQQIKI